MMKHPKIFLLASLAVLPLSLGAKDTDLIVYGGTPAGIAAAIQAAEQDLSVLIVEPYSRVGGMLTNGLNHPDFRSFESITGFYYKFTQRSLDYYTRKYGEDSQQVEDTFRGTHVEPHVAQLLLHQMIAEYGGIEVVTRFELLEARLNEEGTRIKSIKVQNNVGATFELRADAYIDATYEGDLMAAAGAPYRVGREAKSEYGERLAAETADDQVMGYNFRLTMTNVPENRAPVPQPDNYDSQDFAPVLAALKEGKIQSIFGLAKDSIYKTMIPALPNGKRDVNDVSRGLFRLSLPQYSKYWPDAGIAERKELFQKHVYHNIGMLYFLQNDPAVPDTFREQAIEWGLCRDEFTDNLHLPEQLYVREGRRMIGMRVFNENDTLHDGGDARVVHKPDSIGIGDYSINSHGSGREGGLFIGEHTGEFYSPIPAFEIPFGTIVPKGIENLLVPVAASSSHIGMCALRYEPTWSSLGDAAGAAAAIAVAEGIPVQEIDVARLQRALHTSGAATTYVSDVLPEHPDFQAVQWWASLGGLMGLYSKPTSRIRGATILGQHCEAFPGHAVDLDTAMTPELTIKWNSLLQNQGQNALQAETRGDFIRGAWAAIQK